MPKYTIAQWNITKIIFFYSWELVLQWLNIPSSLSVSSLICHKEQKRTWHNLL